MIEYILVTGSTGFLGTHIVHTLSKKYKNIIILIRSTSDISKIKNIEGITFWNIDNQSIVLLFDKYIIEGIIHLATYYKKTHSQEDIKPMIQTNISFPLEILNLAIEKKVRWFINTGSGAEYEQSNVLLDNTSDLNPENLYAKTKIAFEYLSGGLLKNSKMSYLSMIIFSPFGIGEKDFKLIPTIIDRIKSNKQLVLNSPDQKLDLIYVEDIAEFYLKAIDFAKHKEKIFYRFNVGSGKVYTVENIVQEVEKLLNQKANITYKNESKIIERYPDVRDIEHKLNYKANTSLNQGLLKIIESYDGID